MRYPSLPVLGVTMACAWGSLAAQTVAPDSTVACAAPSVGSNENALSRAPDARLDLTPAGGGRLVYIGAEHSRDPAHPQVEQIRRAWTETQPTVAFYEGPDRPIAATAEETILTTGESGYVRFLARADGARVERLEPSPVDEFDAVREQFTLDQVKLFYVLRETARLREREGLDGPALEAAVARLLAQAQALFGERFGAPWTVADLDAAYRRTWSEPADWHQAPAAWFTPGGDPAVTGGQFTHAVNRASSAFRDRHMIAVLTEAAGQGERVFAVVGRDHVLAQAAALRCALR